MDDLRKQTAQWKFCAHNSERLKDFILQHVEPLLCNDCETGKYIRTVSRQRLGKRVLTQQT
jgi:hypothetical protein